MKPLIVSNMKLGDETFDSDVGSWNVTRAKNDCQAGKHKLYLVDVRELYEHNKRVEVDPAKVRSLATDHMGDAPPLILVGDGGKDWLIDGHHRLRALHRIGFAECVAYVIEEKDAEPYRIYYNGERIAPWFKERA
jgi:hypothetical protein